MPHYDDIILTDTILLGSSTSYDDGSSVIRTRAGWQQTIEFTSNPLSVMTITYAMTTTEARVLANILNTVRRSNSFNAINWSNHLTTLDQSAGAIGTQAFDDFPMRNPNTGLQVGDGTTTTFELIQSFKAGSLERTRRILKPIAADFLPGVGGAPSPGGTLDAVNGRYTFNTAPGNGAPVTWGGRFYTPIYNSSPQIVTENFISQPNTESTGLVFLEALLETT